MTRASRIVLIASLLTMSMAVVGVSTAGAVPIPTQVSALTTSFGCARQSDATVRCSGQNGVGQLGNGTTTFSPVPVIVKNPAGTGSLTGVSQVATSGAYACARLTNGTVDCWGDNSFGQLGNGAITGAPNPLPIAVKNTSGTGALGGVVQISTGSFNTCARLSNGGIDCWGQNGDYQLGDGNNVTSLIPHAVLNGAGHGPIVSQTSVSVGQYNVCSSQSDGSARCWGLNQSGVLGVGAGVPFAPLPVRVKAVSGSGFLANVTSISAAPNHTCALLKNGTADCWGANTFGQLGDGTLTTRLRPVPVRNVLGTATLIHIAQITTGGGSSGGDHTCVRLLAKTALCWGGNTFGQLGDGTKVTRHRPVIVKAPNGIGSLINVTSIVAGPIDTCAMLTSGGARCWGFNQGGQFGNGQAVNRTRPTPAAP